jgi:prephenate dehydrogenase
VMTNQPNLANALGVMIEELERVREALSQRDYNAISDLYAQANQSVNEHRATQYKTFERVK